MREVEIKHKSEGSFEEFWESEKKKKKIFKSIDKNLDINLPNPIAQTKKLLLKRKMKCNIKIRIWSWIWDISIYKLL